MNLTAKEPTGRANKKIKGQPIDNNKRNTIRGDKQEQS